jgi:hypothetical protein
LKLLIKNNSPEITQTSCKVNGWARKGKESNIKGTNDKLAAGNKKAPTLPPALYVENTK